MSQRTFSPHPRRKRRRSPLPGLCLAALALWAALAAVPPSQPGETSGLPPEGGQAPAVSAPAESQPPVLPSPTAAPPADSQLPSPAPEADWRLLLVNRQNPLPEGYDVSLLRLSNGLSVDRRCYPDLQAMMDDCRAAGLSPVICSAYRTQETQERLYQNEVDAQLALGLPRPEAEVQAGQAVALPGTSEHQTGLALDIVDMGYQLLDRAQEDTPVQQWLLAHSWEYGFILRYPAGTSQFTGILYEPWHYRYVGRDAARDIHSLGVCLEEYLAGG